MNIIRFIILSGLILSCASCFSQEKKNAVKFDNSLWSIRYEYSSDSIDFYSASDNKNNSPKQNMPIFAIMTHPGSTRNSSINYIEFQKNRIYKRGNKILKVIEEDTSINGNKFYAMTINTIDTLTNQKETMLYGFLLKHDDAIIFLGSDMGRHEYFDKLKKTFYSMRL
jgi:hypothetical protein